MISDFVIDYVYSYEENYLKIKAPNFNFNLNLRAPITVICGNSATGKTLLLNTIHEVQKFRQDAGLAARNPVIVFFGDETIEFEDVEQLVIIDRGDFCLTDEICDKIRNCKRTKFLIMARGLHNLGLTPNYYAELVRSNTELSLHYKFSERLWFI